MSTTACQPCQPLTWHVMVPRWPTVSVGMLPVGGPLKSHTVFLSPPEAEGRGGTGWR